MRINLYSQELTDEVALVSKDGKDADGQPARFHGVRLYLHSPQQLHYTREDDDRSAVTFWLAKSHARRAALASALREMAALVEGTIHP